MLATRFLPSRGCPVNEFAFKKNSKRTQEDWKKHNHQTRKISAASKTKAMREAKKVDLRSIDI